MIGAAFQTRGCFGELTAANQPQAHLLPRGCAAIGCWGSAVAGEGSALLSPASTLRWPRVGCRMPSSSSLSSSLPRQCSDPSRETVGSMLSCNNSEEASSPRTVYGSDNGHGFPGMEVYLADQTPELVPAERLANLNQPERSPSTEQKPWLSFGKAKNENPQPPADTKRSRNWRLWLLITILAVGIIVALAIALPLSLRPQRRESR